MEGQEYLNQISASNRPVKKSSGGILSSKFFWVGLIGIIALIIILIIGALLGGNKGGEKNLGYGLKLHIENVSEMISKYQSNVKSSNLRSSSASLSTILSNTNKELTEYLNTKYGVKDKDINQNLVSDAAMAKDALDQELFKAKINGILDRIYAHKMTYEISAIQNEEAKIINTTKSPELKGLLQTSYTSLENLYNNFNDFSETK